MAAPQGTTPESILKDLQAGKIAPVYYLMGEEPYYIDKLSAQIVRTLLKPEEEDFNLDLLYGNEVSIDRIIERAQTYPMMAERRVVLVREAQGLRNIDAFEAYLNHYTPSTVVVFCHKHGKLDVRRNVSKAILKFGVVYESKRVYESHLPAFITQYLRKGGAEAEPKAMQMLTNYVGTDLSRVASELDKLMLGIPQGGRRITAQMVEALTGISKDYNSFELVDALARKDIYKANQILMYFKGNPRSFALPQVLSNLFTFFSDLMTAFYAPNKTPQGFAEWLGRPQWKVNQEIVPAYKNYSGVKVMHILGEIRRTDAASKGVGGCKTPPGELLQELVFMILH